MNLYDQLITLQTIPNAYEEWAKYREEVTHYILEHTCGCRQLAIFGVGHCNDIDLRLLASYFEKVYLFDQDKEAMKEALRQYGLWEHPRIEMKVASFTGVLENDLRDYADELVKEVRRRGLLTETQELAGVAHELLREIEEKIEEFVISFEQYENTVILGVHSQLLNMLEWIWSIVLQTIGKEEQSVRQKIIQLNDVAVEKLNEALLKATKEHMIIGCEESRIGQIGMIQGAFQAMRDIEERNKKKQVKILDETYLIWPFNEKETKCYRMKLQVVKPFK